MCYNQRQTQNNYTRKKNKMMIHGNTTCKGQWKIKFASVTPSWHDNLFCLHRKTLLFIQGWRTILVDFVHGGKSPGPRFVRKVDPFDGQRPIAVSWLTHNLRRNMCLNHSTTGAHVVLFFILLYINELPHITLFFHRRT